ncbi:MAG TPA: tetratricopeptide repeat protein [Gammaproteobacteria bacterium]
MSLLMDALKRAEKARQAEAAKQGAGEEASRSQSLSLEQQDDRSRSNAPPPERAASEQDDPPVSSPASKGPHTTEYLRPFSLMDDDAISPEESGEMQSIAREAEDAVKKYFDDTGAMEIAVEDEADADAVAGPRGSTSGETDRKAASAVFEAKYPGRRRRGYTAVIVVPVFLVLFLGVSGFFLWDELVRVFIGGGPSLVVRRPPPPADLAAPALREAARAETVSPAVMESPTADSAAGTPRPEQGAEIPQSAGGATGESAEMRKLAAAAEAASAESDPTAEESVEPPAPEARAAAAPDVTPPESAPASPEREAGENIAELTAGALGNLAGAGHLSAVPTLRISRQPLHDRMHGTLREAYEAFQRGDNARARNLYDRVLSVDPRNRNALLGLGAIDTRIGNTDAARRTYARLLSLNPRDPVARAALIDSHREVSPAEGEGHIKALLAQNPDQPFLYATLGNLYARQQRWPEAQQAYFDAYRLDQDNADYAFNLAVSLDRLGQGTTALSFYRRALDLAEGAQASFEPQTVLKRISTLAAAGSR